MKNYFHILLFVLLNLIQMQVYAQDPVMDSLKLALKNAKHDTLKVNTLNTLSFNFYRKGDYFKALSYTQEALSLSERISFQKGKADSYVNLGLISNSQGQNSKALDEYFKAVTIYEKLNYRKKIADTYINIGITYRETNNNAKVKEFYFKALEIFRKINNKGGEAIALSNIGIAFLKEGQLMKNKDSAFLKYDKAIEYHINASKVMEDLNDKWNLSAMLINISNSYRQKQDYEEAIIYANRSMVFAKKIGAKRILSNCYNILSDLYYIKKEYKSAYDYSQLYYLYNDSLRSEEIQKKLLEAQMTYDFEKKEALSKAEYIAHNKRQKIIILAIMLGLFLVIIFSFFLYKRFKITKKQNEVIAHQKVLVDEAYKDLHEKNKEVMDSITYARRIQRALITPEAYIEKTLNRLEKKD